MLYAYAFVSLGDASLHQGDLAGANRGLELRTFVDEPDPNPDPDVFAGVKNWREQARGQQKPHQHDLHLQGKNRIRCCKTINNANFSLV